MPGTETTSNEVVMNVPREEVGVADRLHLWPDKSLGNVGVANRMPKPKEYLRWLCSSWERISEWPISRRF